MTDGDECDQNAVAEKVDGILKMQYLLRKSKGIIQARKMVVKSIEIYNQIKPNKVPKLQNAR